MTRDAVAKRSKKERERKCTMLEVRKWQCYLMECESEMMGERCEEKLGVLMLIFFGEKREKRSGIV